MIIVTGGAGFIGRNIIKGLNNAQHKNIIVVDNLKNGEKYVNLIDLQIMDYIDKNYFIKNLTNNSYIKKIDVIFHEGACSSTTEWNGKYMMYNNYQYSKKLLLYCVKHNIPFIYASSAAVYGKNVDAVLKTDQCECPANIYSYSKFLFDQYVRNISPKITSQVCGLRYFNVYGPYETHKGNMASIIFRIYKQIKYKNHPTLFIGSNNFKRDFIHVNDIIDINLWIWNNNISGIFDCGTGIAESFEHVAKIVLNFFDQNFIQYIPMPKKLKKHYQNFTQANSMHLKKVGYNKTFINITDGIHQYLNWLISNDI